MNNSPLSTLHSQLSALAVATFLLVAPSRVAGETIIDKKREFKLKVPAGFTPNKGPFAFTPDTLYSFVRTDPTNSDNEISLRDHNAVRGTIGREHLKPEDLPAGSDARLFIEHWQGFEVDAFEVRLDLLGYSTLTYNVQIPLKGEAIQVQVSGFAEQETELKQVLTEVLEGLRGESSWIASAFPTWPITSSKNYGAILIGCGIAFVVCGLIVLFLVYRKGTSGLVLALAAAIYFGSRPIDDVRLREVMMLATSMKILALLGVILGLIGSNPRLKSLRDESAGIQPQRVDPSHDA